MQGIIIQELENLSINANPKLVIKLNKEFKDMGFKKVYIGNNLLKESLESDLTLHITPIYYNSTQINLTNSNEKRKEILEKINKDFAIKGSYRSMVNGNNYYGTLNKDYEEIKNKEGIFLGFYFKKKNIVSIEYPFLVDDTDYSKDKIKQYFINSIKEWIAERKPQIEDVSKEKEKILLNGFIENLKTRINILESDITTLNNSAERSAQNYLNCIKDLEVKRLEIEGVREYNKKGVDKLRIELEETKKLPFISKIDLEGNKIILYFKSISVTFQKETIELGEYKAELTPTKIIIKNLNPLKIPLNLDENEDYEEDTDTYDNLFTDIQDGNYFLGHHFHAREEGGYSVCLGDKKLRMYELLGTFQIKKLAYMIQLFLKGYTPNDNYVSWEKWKIAKKLNEDYEK